MWANSGLPSPSMPLFLGMFRGLLENTEREKGDSKGEPQI